MMDFSPFSGSRVLVTGGSGFIGSMLCERFCGLGATVFSVSRGTQSTPGSCVSWRRGDLADSGFVDELFKSIKPDFVYHLASEVTGSRELNLVLPTMRGNLVSAVNILVAATGNHCRRIVMAGSLEEPDESEQAAIPCSPYAAAKWAASGYARMFHALYQTPVVLARLFMVYGPGQKDLRKLVPYVTLSLLQQEIPELASGTREVDWIYVKDVVNGLLLAGLTAGIDGTTVELGSGQLATIREVAETLRDIINPEIQPRFGALADRPMEQVRVARVKKTYEQLGWCPEYSLRQGLEGTVAYYRERLADGRIE